MIPQLPVTVVLNGQTIPSSRAPRIVEGTVMVPVEPFMVRIASESASDGTGSRWTFVRSGRRVTLTIGRRTLLAGSETMPLSAAPFSGQGTVFVPVAAIVRAFGGSAAFSSAQKTLLVELAPVPAGTMTPFDPALPQATPTRLFTPVPVSTPRPVLSSVPLPRRTPIPAIPSRP